jgi:hypothetical protein
MARLVKTDYVLTTSVPPEVMRENVLYEFNRVPHFTYKTVWFDGDTFCITQEDFMDFACAVGKLEEKWTKHEEG